MHNLLNFLKDHSIIAYLITDKDGNVLDSSNNLSEFLRKDKRLLSLIRPFLWLEDIPKFETFYSNLLRTGHEEKYFEMKLSRNSYQQKRLLGCKLQGPKEEYFIGIGNKNSDIATDRVNTKNNEEFYRDFSKVFTGIYLELNDKFEIINLLGDTHGYFGLYENDFLNNFKDLSDYVYEEDLEKHKIVHDIPSISKNLTNFIFRLKRNDGTFFWVLEFIILVEHKNEKTIHLLIYDINDFKIKYDALLESKNQILELANHLELTREEERKNMAREIHDEIGHALTSLKLNINLLLKKRYLREDKLEARLGDMMKHIEETIRMLQRISAQLRPSILDHFGLIAALEWQAKEFQRQTSIRCKYSIPEEDIEINERKTVAVFRIFQEILTNITRHSQASRVDVILTIENNILDLKVSDNGIGIRKEDLESPKSLGLIGLKERANLVEGKLTINTILNMGTTVQLILPIN